MKRQLKIIIIIVRMSFNCPIYICAQHISFTSLEFYFYCRKHSVPRPTLQLRREQNLAASLWQRSIVMAHTG